MKKQSEGFVGKNRLRSGSGGSFVGFVGSFVGWEKARESFTIAARRGFVGFVGSFLRQNIEESLFSQAILEHSNDG